MPSANELNLRIITAISPANKKATEAAFVQIFLFKPIQALTEHPGQFPEPHAADRPADEQPMQI
jgi:hypothetical protein